MSRTLLNTFTAFAFGTLIALTAACGKDSSTAPAPSPPAPPQPPPPAPTPVATRIDVTPASATLTTIGQTVQLNAQVFDQNNNVMTGAVITWTSVDPRIASVGTGGLVTAAKYGTTRITAQSGNATQRVEVRVVQTVGRIAVEPTEATLTALGETVQLAATVQDRSGQTIVGANVTWRSSDTAVASVSASGLVTAVGNGTARITARSGSTEQGVTVKVMQAPAGIAVDPSEATLTAIGETVQLEARVFDSNDMNIEGAGVTWQSSDVSVANVSPNGLVIAVANGAASITATSGSFSDSTEVTVMQTPASIAIDPERAILAEVGMTLQLTASVLDLNGHRVDGADVTWASSDEAIATVDDQGLVTAVAGGTVEIAARSGEISAVSAITVKGVGLDRETLTALYHATNGDEWTNNENWLSDAPLSDWHGVSTTFAGTVTSIRLGQNNLSGFIPAELCQLSSLERLELPRNQLTGPIPPELGLLTNLSFLWLASNELTGSIPPELGQLINLGLLWLDDNRLTGGIPPEFGELTSLRGLDISSNALTGVLPPELGQLTSLTTLFLLNNEMTGIIPPELGQLINLKDLILAGNAFTGTIPPELGQTKLVRLLLTSNKLTGEIPLELAQLADLTDLSLDGNMLTGIIPPELAQLTRLEQLTLSQNRLTGTIPPELTQLAHLDNLNLSQNRLTGTIPPELGQLASLERLILDQNMLTGTIPSELAQLSNLESLFIGQNRLTGTIPPELGHIGGLRTLAIDNNQLTGGIPDELGQLTSLIWLWLEGNPGLTGPLPNSFTGLTSMNFLKLNNTSLCVPPTAVFRTWIDGIQSADGVVYCSGP